MTTEARATDIDTTPEAGERLCGFLTPDSMAVSTPFQRDDVLLWARQFIRALSARLALLEQTLQQMHGPLSIAALEARAEAAEARLAALDTEAIAALVEALEWYADDPSSQGDVARKALARVKGQTP